MKIHISINNQPLNGYINLTSMGGEGTAVGDFRNFDDLCPAASCDEIYAPDMLDYIHGSQLVHIVKYWISRLRHQGKIIIGGTDLFELCKGVVCGQLNAVEANRLIFSQVNMSPFIKSGLYTTSDTEALLAESGLKILYKRASNRKFTIEAQRN